MTKKIRRTLLAATAAAGIVVMTAAPASAEGTVLAIGPGRFDVVQHGKPTVFTYVGHDPTIGRASSGHYGLYQFSATTAFASGTWLAYGGSAANY